ncbi:MAG TPA: peptidoglycan DD-metalloendopeptidase family protein [Actinomycetota bacterium]|nr:peptidoglycan DD-metalloendopeptidase family protein [Actinomycetota bacterium]
MNRSAITTKGNCLKRLILAGGALFLLVGQLSPSAALQTPPPTQAGSPASIDTLERLRSDLEAAQERIAAIQRRASTVEAQVASVDRQIARVQEALAISHQLVTETGARLAIIRLEIDEKQRRYRAVENQARAIAVALYKNGPVDELEIILNSRDFGEMAETFRYTAAAADNRRDVMTSLEDLEADLAVVEAKYQEELSKALVAQSKKEELAQQLKELRGVRFAKLTDLRQKISSERGEAEALARQSDRIEQRLAGSYGYDDVVVGDPSAMGFIWPLEGVVTSGFGMRWGRMHQGLDIDGETGDPIRAAKAGTVSMSGVAGGYGNMVVVDHGGGVATLYAHASQLLVTEGQRVQQGEVVALVGSTGFSTGSHLHFEIRINGTPQNPLPFLP